jgi:hypothetical protein
MKKSFKILNFKRGEKKKTHTHIQAFKKQCTISWPYKTPHIDPW